MESIYSTPWIWEYIADKQYSTYSQEPDDCQTAQVSGHLSDKSHGLATAALVSEQCKPITPARNTPHTQTRLMHVALPCSS